MLSNIAAMNFNQLVVKLHSFILVEADSHCKFLILFVFFDNQYNFLELWNTLVAVTYRLQLNLGLFFGTINCELDKKKVKWLLLLFNCVFLRLLGFLARDFIFLWFGFSSF